MLLKGYKKHIFHPECNSNFQSFACIADLDEDITEVLPYLNAELGGRQYLKAPPSVTFKVYGRLITLYSRKIAINVLESQEQADKILEWLKMQINEIWSRHSEIEPSYESAAIPKLIDLLKLMPGTNCKKCGHPTCMVFCTQLIDGGRYPEDCPELSLAKLRALQDYLKRFNIG
jgi:ArsR family metal-binding transcriptional regulator